MKMKLSVVIPAYNEEQNIAACLHELRKTFGEKYRIPYEIICVNDNSRDNTEKVIRGVMQEDPCVRIVNRRPPGGFGRAIRSGLEHVTGDVVIIYMADLSDDPEDAVAYYRKIEEGYDCVYGSRFMKGSVVKQYPRLKLIVNRIVNRTIQILFWTEHNDLSNAFKCYRTSVIKDCGPFRASHFNITLEMSISALIRQYNIASIPISWYGRTWGSSNLRMREMGRRYFCTLLMLFFQRILIKDDLMAERLMQRADHDEELAQVRANLADVDQRIEKLEARLAASTEPLDVASSVTGTE
jgi:dolichol-phosphate mannosyltransferase